VSGFYSREAMRQFRADRESRGHTVEPEQLALDSIPVDAPADDAALTVWNGKRWVAYDTWRARAAVVRAADTPVEEKPAAAATDKKRAPRDGGQASLFPAPEWTNG
jgi:hypothetical protein